MKVLAAEDERMGRGKEMDCQMELSLEERRFKFLCSEEKWWNPCLIVGSRYYVVFFCVYTRCSVSVLHKEENAPASQLYCNKLSVHTHTFCTSWRALCYATHPLCRFHRPIQASFSVGLFPETEWWLGMALTRLSHRIKTCKSLVIYFNVADRSAPVSFVNVADRFALMNHLFFLINKTKSHPISFCRVYPALLSASWQSDWIEVSANRSITVYPLGQMGAKIPTWWL